MTTYEGFQVFIAVADDSMVVWVSRRAVDECFDVSEERTASVLRVSGSSSCGWFTWMHHREPKLFILQMEAVRSTETSKHLHGAFNFEGILIFFSGMEADRNVKVVGGDVAVL